MKLKLLLFALLCIGVMQTYSQTILSTIETQKLKKPNGFTDKQAQTGTHIYDPIAPGEKCGFKLVMENARKKGFSDDAFEQQLSNFIAAKKQSGESFTGTVTIPIIFHVIHRGAATAANLNASFINAQISQLNIDYANLAGTSWPAQAANMRIQFCAAIVGPNGKLLAEPGIERIDAAARGWSNTSTMNLNTVISYCDATIKPQSYWEPRDYFNVWTLDMSSSGLLGYATFPSFSTLPGLDDTETDQLAGVVLSFKSVGSVANPSAYPPYNFGRTLTHEAGHFFGLRHINGDGSCLTDYCADTPPQSALSSGCPAVGTMNGCTPSVPKMFQNYMDYSDDNCLNTFTNDQGTRMNAVMDNSPRRKELITSKACTTRPDNAISFNKKTFDVVETGSAGSCPNSKTYTFEVNTAAKASGNATVTFLTSGTATLGKDYTISPASVSFVNNDAATKYVTITILDDQVIEPNETINLTYSISGTGVVAGPDYQSLTININDDDYNQSINNTTANPTLLSESFNSTALPTGWLIESYSVTNPANQFVVGANGGTGTTTNSLYITNNTSTKPLAYSNTNSSISIAYTPLIDATGLNDIAVSFKYKSNGEANYDYGMIGYVEEGQTRIIDNVYIFNTMLQGRTNLTNFAATLPSTFNGKKFYFVFAWQNDESAGSNPPFLVDDIVITGKNTMIATQTTSDTAFLQYQGTKVNFYSIDAAAPKNNKLLATINNPSEDLNCVTASITQSGTGTATVTSGGINYNRTQKIISIVPAGGSSSTTHQTTIYYTTAELAPFANPNNLKILKVKDGVNMNTTPLSTANAVLVTPTVDNQISTKGYVAYTGSFTNGFSQFTLVEQNFVLPVANLVLTARDGGKNIIVNWNTSMELNNRGFQLQRSTDGLNFEDLVWVQSKGNSTQTTNYQFVDNFVAPNTWYYYRAVQVDIDGSRKLSGTDKAKISETKGNLIITPNPASDQVFIYNSNSTSSFAKIKLYNVQGQLVREWNKVNISQRSQSFNLNGLTKGQYIISIVQDNEIVNQKLLIN